ncbi:hypothetical protein F443_13883 [Phytophthora nicotianae P1569]|uniref:Uncharacterized protein n=1 Tax=Phytophthora nicotianae P1569 TaxID=1317065 RepID=V9ENH4_PHYNI|nr:hypothetical protein F443_13883 [Phytophthora nicotianae P1569]
MAGREDSTRGKGHGRKGRNPGLRQSLCAQGLPPEEQLSLEEVEKAARERNSAKRKAAAEKKEKESSGVQDRDTPDVDVPDAHHAVPDAVAPDVEEMTPSDSARSSHSSASVEFVGVSAPDAPTQASVGGAVKVMCPAEAHQGGQVAKASCRRLGKKPKATPNSGNTDHESESDSAAVSALLRSHDDEEDKEDEAGEAEGMNKDSERAHDLLVLIFARLLPQVMQPQQRDDHEEQQHIACQRGKLMSLWREEKYPKIQNRSREYDTA